MKTFPWTVTWARNSAPLPCLRGSRGVHVVHILMTGHLSLVKTLALITATQKFCAHWGSVTAELMVTWKDKEESRANLIIQGGAAFCSLLLSRPGYSVSSDPEKITSHTRYSCSFVAALKSNWINSSYFGWRAKSPPCVKGSRKLSQTKFHWAFWHTNNCKLFKFSLHVVLTEIVYKVSRMQEMEGNVIV